MPDTFETRDETTLPLRDKAFGIVNSISGYSVSCFLTPPEGTDSKSFAYRDASIGSIIKIATERGSTVFGFIS